MGARILTGKDPDRPLPGIEAAIRLLRLQVIERTAHRQPWSLITSTLHGLNPRVPTERELFHLAKTSEDGEACPGRVRLSQS